MVIGSPDVGHPPGHMEGPFTVPLDLAGPGAPMGSMGSHGLAGSLMVHMGSGLSRFLDACDGSNFEFA